MSISAVGNGKLDPDYRDRKRWAWLLSVVFPLLPLLGVWLHHVSGWEITLAVTMVISYGLMPILDALIGEDLNNPPESAVPRLDADRYYRWLTWATVPLHFVTLIGCAWWAGTQHLSWWGFAILAYSAGAGAGLGLNTAHELGHKHNRWEQWLARLALAVPAYGHFTVEHGRGHHRWVATPSDHASARMGESIYRFAWRELPGGVRRASRRYQSLRDFPDLPRLPSGYFGMFTLAYFPALWFKVMDRRLLALPQVRGDLAKANVAPRQRARLAARYPETAARN